MAKEYEVTVSAMVTIHPSRVFKIVAKNENEAMLRAEQCFHTAMEDRFGYADYDEVTIDDLKQISELPF